MCPHCGEPSANCRCTAGETVIPDGKDIRISRETQGRKGRVVTVIRGLPLDTSDLKDLAKAIKAKCGAGGTVREGNIEIQGDHTDKLLDELHRLGWPARRR